MYSANTLQVNLLVKNVLSVINQEKDLDIEVAIQSEVLFLKMNTENNYMHLTTDKTQNKEYLTTIGRFPPCTELPNFETF